MPTFTCDVVKKPARSKQLDQPGELTLVTRVTVGDSYRRGPVQVSVEFDATFLPDRKFWEHADGDRRSVTRFTSPRVSAHLMRGSFIAGHFMSYFQYPPPNHSLQRTRQNAPG